MIFTSNMLPPSVIMDSNPISNCRFICFSAYHSIPSDSLHASAHMSYLHFDFYLELYSHKVGMVSLPGYASQHIFSRFRIMPLSQWSSSQQMISMYKVWPN